MARQPLRVRCNGGLRFYVILLKKLSDRYSPFFLTALQSFAGVILFFPLIFAGDSPSLDVPLNTALAVVYLATFVTFGGYFLYNWGIAKTSAIEASIFLNFIPVFGLILAFLVLNETPTPFQGLMVGLIIMGVLICELGSKYLPDPGHATVQVISAQPIAWARPMRSPSGARM